MFYSVSMEMLVQHICICNTSKDSMARLRELLYGVGHQKRNELAMFGGFGLYLDITTNKYVFKQGGVPATLSHYAAVRGRTDILEVLTEVGNNHEIAVVDNTGVSITPEGVAMKNGCIESAEFLRSDISKTGRSSLSSCIIA